MTTSVDGRNRTPASSGEKPRTFCMYRAMKKNIANMANETVKATTFAPTNERALKNAKSTIGTRARRSMTTKATPETTESASRPITPAEPQPQLLPSTRARTRAASETVRVPMPGKSTLRSAVSSRDSSAANSVITSAPAATGRFSRKIARHETSSVR